MADDALISVITVDSNVATIPRAVARLLVEPTAEWCSAENRCSRPSSDSRRAFYDTPISMCSSLEACGGTNVPETYLNFVYLDYRARNASFKRILRNIEGRRNVVRILADEGADDAHGTYRLKTSRCTTRGIAEALATIINAFRSTGRLLHPDDISDIVCGLRVAIPRRLTYNMIYDVCALMNRRNACQPILDDCAYGCETSNNSDDNGI